MAWIKNGLSKEKSEDFTNLCVEFGANKEKTDDTPYEAAFRGLQSMLDEHYEKVFQLQYGADAEFSGIKIGNGNSLASKNANKNANKSASKQPRSDFWGGMFSRSAVTS